MKRLACLLLLAACGGGSSSQKQITTTPREQATPDPIPKTAGPPCDEVAPKFAIVAARKPEDQDRLAGIAKARCTDDAWSDEARSCMATAETEDELDGCGKLLTEAQRKAVETEVTGGATAPGASGGASNADTMSTGATKKRKTRGGTRGRSSDPCEGGESKAADPCEGGESRAADPCEGGEGR